MIAQDKVDWVLRLLAEKKLSHREISKTTGISRASIAAIAKGHRPRAAASHIPAGDRQILGVPIRCPNCGGRINVIPCVLCGTLAIAERKKIA